MGKLHELLAVEDDLKNVYMATMKEAGKVFDSSNLFMGWSRTLDKTDERCPDAAPENHKLTTTVYDKLDYVFGKAGDYYDCVYQKESSNQVAMADLVINGHTLAKDVPATFLLGLEKKLDFVRGLLFAIPTLPAGIEVRHDETLGAHVYRRVHPEENFKTIKTVNHKVLVAPTDRHPAQIEKWNEDVIVGRFVKNIWYGFMSPKEKADILERISLLLQEVKKARQRANAISASESKIGGKLFSFILDGNLS